MGIERGLLWACVFFVFMLRHLPLLQQHFDLPRTCVAPRDKHLVWKMRFPRHHLTHTFENAMVQVIWQLMPCPGTKSISFLNNMFKVILYDMNSRPHSKCNSPTTSWDRIRNLTFLQSNMYIAALPADGSLIHCIVPSLESPCSIHARGIIIG